MENVQLLVVNREDRNKLCGVGEVGEIYVRVSDFHGLLYSKGRRREQTLVRRPT